MSRRPRIIRSKDGHVLVERFSLFRRFEHTVVASSFIVLLLTGFPQKFADGAFSHWLIGALGGLENTRLIHRIAGVTFVFQSALHALLILWGAVTGRMRMVLMPGPQDVRDLLANMSHFVGRRRHPPKMPVFDYRQKFEYMGMVLGGLLMVVSGLVLMYPVQVGQWVPGEIVLALRAAHSFEAVLAFVVLLIWHVYGSILSPDVFPLDTSIFTGYMSAEHLREHHALEYERLFGDAPLEAVEAEPQPTPAEVSSPARPGPADERHG
ncbi:MAG: cytochrome b/b6 domain-containing protein [Myxococcales bacterium]|nr:cytochrome b/b6 domain-containing protein [Myxococcales bacterium]